MNQYAVKFPYNYEDYIKLWKAWNKPHFISYPCGHLGIVFQRRKITKDGM